LPGGQSQEPVQDSLFPEARAEPAASAEAANGVAPSRHVEAGRKGAKRFHQLVERGRLYEEEHGLKRGRQRLRQLVQLGRLYEQEHGLAPKRRTGRGPRLSEEQALRRLLDALARVVKPSYRPHLARLVQALENVVE
jgi:hypothetical protein